MKRQRSFFSRPSKTAKKNIKSVHNQNKIKNAKSKPAPESPAIDTEKMTTPSTEWKPTPVYCESFMDRYVEVRAVDGYCYDGIVEYVDQDWVCLAVPGSMEMMRAFFPPYGQISPVRPRRFHRLILPLAAVTGIFLLPYYW